jgi:hypothetical protein
MARRVMTMTQSLRGGLSARGGPAAIPLAERVGFEPTTPVSGAQFCNRRFQPLSHLSPLACRIVSLGSR